MKSKALRWIAAVLALVATLVLPPQVGIAILIRLAEFVVERLIFKRFDVALEIAEKVLQVV